MSQFPNVDAELAALRRFLAAAARASDADAEDFRQRAERMVFRLENPVRIAILGAPEAGKSTVANFLMGHDLIPAHVAGPARAPVIVRHGETAHTVAGWWSGRQIADTRVDFDAAFGRSPDFVELSCPGPVLRNMTFLDVTGVDDAAARAAQLQWAAGRADILLWCQRADSDVGETERRLWSMIPKRLHGRAFLLATHFDAPSLGEDRRQVVARLRALAVPPFRDVLPLSTTIAIEAAPSGSVMDVMAWESSGGKALAQGLFALAAAVRQRDVEAARKMIVSRAAGAEAAPEPLAEPAPAPAPEPPLAAHPATPKIAEPPLADLVPTPEPGHEATLRPQPEAVAGTHCGRHILEHLSDRIETLLIEAKSPDGVENWMFLAKFTELADELSSRVAIPGVLRPDARWMIMQIEEALVSLSQLQMESGDQPCLDAAGIVLQISRDLSWAALPMPKPMPGPGAEA